VIGVNMSLWIIVPFCLFVLALIAGGYLYMFLHVMRCDPKELEFRENIGQDDKLVPHTYK
jgi:hypothetical protein